MCFFFYFIILRPDFYRPLRKQICKVGPAERKNEATNKINTYRKVIEEESNKYEGAAEFICNKINELCSEHGVIY